MTRIQTESGLASILVHVDLAPSAVERGRLAMSLADQHGAHLIGVAAEQQLLEIYSDMSVSVSATASEEERERVEKDLGAARRIFDKAVGSRNDVEWRSCVTDPERFLIQQARAADLVVIGRRPSSEAADGGLGVRPGSIALECGRPILVVPAGADFLAAQKVVVAWKDTREARRAVHDALPILKRADEVVVMTAAAASRDGGAEDVSIWLDRHGVRSRVSIHTGDVDHIAENLLGLADDIGADLIVSGAYGHSRTREWFFGGVTRDLLRSPRHCLFMSH
ncbi:universal stress protein [Chelatococcus sambhunathii]|uniref:Universal stress protein n=1 Tax=Chelatococcus sambhunathii TaxID=363953 RepID=A0ABU1DGU1_9HYPH|nr:universal stress protein [Chelatococcus sambhunathii]MDR4307258.1 universal stress protein [Chelatococcus sambhunathii]